jgi:hypothetical protein
VHRFLTKFIIVIFSFIPLLSSSQVDDVGVWLGVSIQKPLTRQLDIAFTEQLRLKQDATSIDVILSDLALEYAISKKFKTAIHYRLINSNQDTYYSKRHRFYLDVAYKEKIGKVSLTLRERIQQQFNDYYSSETGKIPVWTLRSKLTAKFDLEKKYMPYLSGEMYYLVDNDEEEDQLISRFRYEAGITYDFNRTHGLNPFVLFQHSRSPIYDELIFGIVYSLTL